jgi:hypothetical protein
MEKPADAGRAAPRQPVQRGRDQDDDVAGFSSLAAVSSVVREDSPGTLKCQPDSSLEHPSSNGVFCCSVPVCLFLLSWKLPCPCVGTTFGSSSSSICTEINQSYPTMYCGCWQYSK